jgi:hypothetical protein
VNEAIGQRIYLDRDQCEHFNVSYTAVGEDFVCSAEAILKSKWQGYDKFHNDLLKPLGPKTVVGIGHGHGWFKITEVR